jgi:thiamine kinase-like enzyme
LNLELKTLEPETELIAFGVLTDSEKARKFLERSFRSASPAYRDLQIQSCTPEIARYKPGDRCTILYHLEYASDLPAEIHAPPLIVAKTTRPEKGQNAYAGLSALWNSPFGSNGSVHIAEPIAYDPELNVFVQGPVLEEQTLAELFLTALDEGTPETLAAASQVMRKTAQGLAELHQSGVVIGQAVSWANELEEVEANLFPLCAVFPEIATNAEPFLNRIRQLEVATSPDPFVPSHGTFRPVQVLLHNGQLGFIDFDSFCQSEPARDLSMFLTSMMSISLALPSASNGKVFDPLIADPAAWEARFERVASIREQFLNEYERRRPVSRQRVVLWEALNLFYFVVSGWTKAKTGEVPLLAKLLDRFLLASRLVEA